MASKDIFNRESTINSLRSAARTATANGTGVDTQGFEGVICSFDAGTFGGTTPTATVRIEESDDNSTYTAVADTDLQGGANNIALAGATTPATYSRGYIGKKRYLRWAISAMAGTSPSLPCAAWFVRGSARTLPVTQGS